MKKRSCIMLVARNSQGELRKIPVPMRCVYVFAAGTLLGIATLACMGGAYARMLARAQNLNQLRNEKEPLKSEYTQLEQIAQENLRQAQSLNPLVGEVSLPYGIKPDPGFQDDDPVSASIQQRYALRTTAMVGAADVGISSMANGELREASTRDWMRRVVAPTLWPVQGRISANFGERIDPFSGEGAFHRGVDIASEIGTKVMAPADGVVEYSDLMNGYGRTVLIDHGNGVSTLYGHLSGFAVGPGQIVHRGDILGYVGQSGRSTGPHLHYEVRILNTPVNPLKYLRVNLSPQVASGAM